MKPSVTYTDITGIRSGGLFLFYYMYNSGEKMTTSKAMEITGRSRNFIIETLHKLCGIGIIKWRGTSSNDPKQHYILVDSKESKVK